MLAPAKAPPMRGFSLIEMIVVMVLMGILAAVAVPRLMSDDSRTWTTIETLRSNLQQAQRIAVARNRDVCVQVAATLVRFTWAPTSGRGVACNGSVEMPGSSGDVLDVSAPAGSGLQFGANGIFRFTPAGPIAANNGNALASRLITVSKSGSSLATLTVQADNGYVLASNY